MTDLPAPIRRRLRRLARRLALGLFLDIWPPWAAAALLAAGLATLCCRMFVPRAAPFLYWLWIAPAAAVVPAALLSRLRAFRPEDVVAAADSLAGGSGTLLAVHETRDAAWIDSPALARASEFPLPRIRPWRLAPSRPPPCSSRRRSCFRSAPRARRTPRSPTRWRQASQRPSPN
jgi:hypothetical protein